MEQVTYTFDICFNVHETTNAGITDVSKIMKPVYEKWNVNSYAHETGPFGNPKEVLDITAVEGVKPEAIREILDYFKDYPYVTLKWFTKHVGDTECEDDCKNYTCKSCKNTFSLWGIEKEEKWDKYIPDHFTELDKHLLNNYE